VPGPGGDFLEPHIEILPLKILANCGAERMRPCVDRRKSYRLNVVNELNRQLPPAPPLVACAEVVTRLHFKLLVGTIASAFVFRIPHPIIAFDGPHGSAKTFASNVVAGLIDPTSGHQRVPNSAQDLLAGVRHSWIYALDNLTHIKEWLANDLCGLVTGYRSDSRKLYTNDEVHSVTLKRVVILSSTHYSGIARSDLVERTIFFPTPFIGEGTRKAEEDLIGQLIPLVPHILGRVFSLVSAGFRGLDRQEVRELKLPRMADFGRFLAAIDAELGGDRFERYRQKLRTSVRRE
jgi:hypothetical protein